MKKNVLEGANIIAVGALDPADRQGSDPRDGPSSSDLPPPRHPTPPPGRAGCRPRSRPSANPRPSAAPCSVSSSVYPIRHKSRRPRPREFSGAGEPISTVALFVAILGRARPRPRIPPRPRPRARPPGRPSSPPRSGSASTRYRSDPGPGSWRGIGRGSTPTRSLWVRWRGCSGQGSDRRPACHRTNRSP